VSADVEKWNTDIITIDLQIIKLTMKVNIRRYIQENKNDRITAVTIHRALVELASQTRLRLVEKLAASLFIV
jgi:hypothetical protein